MNASGKIILALVFLAIVFYNIRTARTQTEGFSGATPPLKVFNPSMTTTDLYDKNPSVLCDVSYYGGSYLTDANALLHARYCLRHADRSTMGSEAIDTYTPLKGMLDVVRPLSVYTETFQLDVFNIDTVYRKIQNQLAFFKISNGKTESPIQGPVFLLMAQAPYIVDEMGQPIHQQPFQTSAAYEQHPILAPGDTKTPVKGLRVYGMLLYPMYSSQRSAVDIERADFDFRTYFTEKMQPLWAKKSPSHLCKIKCMGEPGLLCGCANQSEPYRSRCMGEALAGDYQNQQQFTDYWMMYRINELFGKVDGLFSGTFFEDIKI